MEVKQLDNIEIYQRAVEIQQIANDAAEMVRKENKELGVPIVFSRDGIIYYEMPDGEITTKSPFKENDDR